MTEWLIDCCSGEGTPSLIHASTHSTAEPHPQPLDLFLDLLNCVFILSQTLFWSKSKHLAHQYTLVQGSIFTLEDTLLGYIADDLRWCGDPSTSGKDLNHLRRFRVQGNGSLSWAKDFERSVGTCPNAIGTLNGKSGS